MRSVYSHAGEPSGFQRSSSWLFCLPANGGPAREAGILHGHHEDASAGADGRARAEQKPQTHAEEVKLRETLGRAWFASDVEDVDHLCRLCRSETVVDRMLYNWMSICLYQFLRVTTFILFCFSLFSGPDKQELFFKKKRIKLDKRFSKQNPRLCVSGHSRRTFIQTLQGLEAPGGEGAGGCQDEESQVHPERHGPAGRRCGVLCPGASRPRTRWSTGASHCNVCLWCQTLQVLVHGEGPDVTPVKVLNCDTITQVSEFHGVTERSLLSIKLMSRVSCPGEGEDHRSGVQKPAVLAASQGGERRSG